MTRYQITAVMLTLLIVGCSDGTISAPQADLNEIGGMVCDARLSDDLWSISSDYTLTPVERVRAELNAHEQHDRCLLNTDRVACDIYKPSGNPSGWASDDWADHRQFRACVDSLNQ